MGENLKANKTNMILEDVKPVKLAVVGTVILLCLSALVAGGWGYTTISVSQAIHNQQVLESELHYRETTSAIRNAMPTCRAFLNMDNVRFTSPPVNAYDKNIANAIHRFYTISDCRVILSGKPLPEILKELKGRF